MDNAETNDVNTRTAAADGPVPPESDEKKRGSTMSQILQVASVAVVLTGGAIAIALFSTPATATSSVAWSPSKVVKQIPRGGTESMDFLLTASTSVSEPVTISVVPALASFIQQIAPSTLPNLTENQPVPVTVTFSVPASSAVGVFDGALQIRAVSKPSNVYSKPLPVLLTICNCGIVGDVSLTFPSDWQSKRTDRLFSPDVVRLQTSENAYSNGGVLNEGEAGIVVSRVDLPDMPLHEYIAEHTHESALQTSEPTHVAGIPATRITYAEWNSPRSDSQLVTTYVPYGNSLYRFLLVYIAGDPREQKYLSDFAQILNNVQFGQQ